MNLFEYLRNNDYPGRGILVGSCHNKRMIAYFIMGRSENSRNRVFVKENDILYTKAYDESKVADPSLILYNAIRKIADQTIVTNGDQTDTVYDFLTKGKTFEEALETRTYEPDAPNFTPRISAIVNDEGYTLSILRKKEEDCQRDFYSYEAKEGICHFLSTYDHNGDPLPSFSGEPLTFSIEDPKTFPKDLWESLDPENKISLYVLIDSEEFLFNKNEGD